MKKAKSIALLLSVVLLFTAVFCGCGSGTTAESTSAAPSAEPSAAPVEQTLVMGGIKDLKTLSGGKTLVFDVLMDSLDDMSSGPRIVTECTPNDDYTEYTLKIRNDVTFSDGTKLTADIVKFDLEYWPSHRSCGYADYLDTVSVVDDSTLKVTFKDSYGSFLDELQRIYVTKPESVDDKGNITDWTGTGPYILQDYQKDMSATLIRNESYWRKDKMPGITKVEFKVIADENARILAIKSGDIDVIGLGEDSSATSYANVYALQNEPALGVIINTNNATSQTYSINWQSGVCTDINVRKALAYGIDRETLCSKALFGIATPADRYISTKAAYAPKDATFSYDPDKAKEYLKDSGYTDIDGDGYVDKNGTKLTVDLLVKDTQQNRNVAVYYQDCLKQIGVDVKLEVLDTDTFKSRVHEGSWDLCQSHPWYGPISYYMVWRGDINTYDDYGTGYRVNDRVHELTQAILQSGDPAEREKCFDEFWGIANEFVAGIPLFNSPSTMTFNKKVEGLHFCPSSSQIDLSGVVIK